MAAVAICARLAAALTVASALMKWAPPYMFWISWRNTACGCWKLYPFLAMQADHACVAFFTATSFRIADPARTWRMRITDGLATVGDEELLRRAVDNLLMNVLVHTPADTAGTITASAASGRVTIEVSDDGPGVPPDQLPHIFERFYRAGARSGRSGAGLGLAIAA